MESMIRKDIWGKLFILAIFFESWFFLYCALPGLKPLFNGNILDVLVSSAILSLFGVGLFMAGLFFTVNMILSGPKVDITEVGK